MSWGGDESFEDSAYLTERNGVDGSSIGVACQKINRGEILQNERAVNSGAVESVPGERLRTSLVVVLREKKSPKSFCKVDAPSCFVQRQKKYGTGNKPFML